MKFEDNRESIYIFYKPFLKNEDPGLIINNSGKVECVSLSSKEEIENVFYMIQAR